MGRTTIPLPWSAKTPYWDLSEARFDPQEYILLILAEVSRRYLPFPIALPATPIKVSQGDQHKNLQDV